MPVQLYPTDLATTQWSPGPKDICTLLASKILEHNHNINIWSVFVLISLAPFVGGIREPRGWNWLFPSHSIFYHFHSSIYHWREMEKGHSACAFSTNHHQLYDSNMDAQSNKHHECVELKHFWRQCRGQSYLWMWFNICLHCLCQPYKYGQEQEANCTNQFHVVDQTR